MRVIKIYPSNKEQVINLEKFAERIISICNKIDVELIAYGSLILFGYTKNKSLMINDIDFLISEKAFVKIMKELDKISIKYDYSKEWPTLQITDGDLKIELDSKDFWQKDLPNEFEDFDFNGLIVKAVSLNTLRNIYKKASEVSKDNPHGNLKKFKMLWGLK